MTEAKDIKVGDIKHLPSQRPEGSQAASVMTMEATVEVNPQLLKRIRGFHDMTKQVPSTLKPESQIVLQALFACFDKQRAVQEGLIGDLLWGFEQGGIPAGCSALGLSELEKAGYVKFQAPDNTYVTFADDKADKAWVRYQPKLLEMIYEGEG